MWEAYAFYFNFNLSLVFDILGFFKNNYSTQACWM